MLSGAAKRVIGAEFQVSWVQQVVDPEGQHPHRGRHQVRKSEEPHDHVRKGHQTNEVEFQLQRIKSNFHN